MKLLRRIVRSVLNRSKPIVVEWVSAVRSYNVHFKYSFGERNPEKDRENLRYYIIKHCHIIEKGMALPEPRAAFGQPKIKDLIARTKVYEDLGGTDVLEIVRDALRKYREVHLGKEELFEPGFIQELEAFIGSGAPAGKGGLKRLKKEQWGNWSVDKYGEFLSFRHSVRDFSNIAVEPELLKSAIVASLKTPSVCNRQGWFVHYYDDKSKILELLSYQNGNSGFTECIDKLLIITGNSKAFTKNEHNQLFVDGGLISMNLMLAIHAAGLGSCPLNTCMSYTKEKKLKVAAGIPQYERPIMMIAVGNLKEEFSVAQSERYDLDQVLKQH